MALLLMMTSVAALNPTRRLKSAATALSRTSTHLDGKNVLQYRHQDYFRRSFRSYVIQSSQLEYDQRKTSNYQPYDPNGLKIEKSSYFNANENDKSKSIGTQSSSSELTIPTNTASNRAINIKVVDTVEKAQAVLAIMYAQHKSNPNTVWACDTEVADIDLSLVGKYLRTNE